MTEIIKFENIDLCCDIETIKVGEEVWFKGKDIASALDYTDAKQAIRNHVDSDDKMQLSELLSGVVVKTPPTWNEKQAMFINESGLYSLILSSKKEEAKVFKKWVTSEVLPTIRKTGSYVAPALLDKQIVLKDEKDLHYKVINYIREYYSSAIIIAGLGENQDTIPKRIDSKCKGYTKGQPDIIIANKHKYYSGLAIELKNPNGLGRLSPEQADVLDRLDDNNYKTIVSNDYDYIITSIIEYFRDIRVYCKLCGKCFLTKDTLNSHRIHFHRITL